MSGSERPVWSAFHTTDIDQAHAHMSAAYMEIPVRRTLPAQHFSLTTEMARLGDAVVSRAGYRARTRLDAMEERAHADVSELELAIAARVSPAELGTAFRGHLSVTPGASLRQIRLDRANEELLYPDPDAGPEPPDLLEVARRWGFADRAGFTAAYRAAYGRTPDETLTAGPRRSRARSSPSRPG